MCGDRSRDSRCLGNRRWLWTGAHGGSWVLGVLWVWVGFRGGFRGCVHMRKLVRVHTARTVAPPVKIVRTHSLSDFQTSSPVLYQLHTSL